MTESLCPDLPHMHDRGDGVTLASRFAGGAGPLLVFLPGYMSDMDGGKAQAMFAHARARGQAALLFDYSGCGRSDGAFADGTLDVWRDDALFLIDQYWDGAIVTVGSSMGGWIALLIALARPERTAGMIGIAAAPDFTRWGFTDAEKALLATEGQLVEDSDHADIPYVTTLNFWRSGERNLLLGSTIAMDGPVRLLHGQRDDVVPQDVPLALMDAISGDDVRLLLIKDGDHRLSRDSDIAALLRAVDEVSGR